MEVSKKVDGNSAEVSIKGRLDTNAAVEVEKSLVIDLLDCGYMASSGLRIVVKAQKVMDANQGTLVLKNVCGDVMEVFDMTGLAELLTFE